MATVSPKILLLAQNRAAGLDLIDFFESHGCECSVATLSSAPDLLQSLAFDLLISMFPLRQDDPVVSMLNGTACRIFYRISVEDGSWWVPLGDGQTRKILGKPALRPAEFAIFLKRFLAEWKAAAEHRVEEQPAETVNSPG
jgi:hypothetical protein